MCLCRIGGHGDLSCRRVRGEPPATLPRGHCRGHLHHRRLRRSHRPLEVTNDDRRGSSEGDSQWLPAERALNHSRRPHRIAQRTYHRRLPRAVASTVPPAATAPSAAVECSRGHFRRRRRCRRRSRRGRCYRVRLEAPTRPENRRRPQGGGAAQAAGARYAGGAHPVPPIVVVLPGGGVGICRRQIFVAAPSARKRADARWPCSREGDG